MSYCRFTKDSDVYAYECDGGVQFWVAGKANRGLDHLCNTYNEAYQYAKSLRDEHGLDVPDYAIEALRFDALEEVKRFNGPNSAVAELQAENAKLREYTNELLRVVKLGEIDCGACRHFDECYAGDAMDFAPENCRLVVYARELGIEVLE